MPKGVAAKPELDRRIKRGGPESVWKRQEPPKDQVEKHELMKGKPKGAWGKFFAYCQENPNEFFRSHPIMRQQTAVNAASEIKRWILISGQKKLKFTRGDGWWETYWGHAPDDNLLENWYVWVKWVDPRKLPKVTLKALMRESEVGNVDDLIVARTPSVVQTRTKAKSATKKAGKRGTE